MIPNPLEEKRLHHLNADIAKAKAVMQQIRKAFLIDEHWSSFERLTRIYINAEGIFDTFRRSHRLALCRQVLRDLDVIRGFIQDYKKHFPTMRSGPLLIRSFNRLPSNVQERRRSTLRSYQNTDPTNSSRRTAEPDVNTQPRCEAAEDIHSPRRVQEHEVIDLTLESDGCASSVTSSSKPRYHTASFTGSSKCRKTDSPDSMQSETREWRDYELRRYLLLWHEPLEHLDQDMLP